MTTQSLSNMARPIKTDNLTKEIQDANKKLAEKIRQAAAELIKENQVKEDEED
jgi:uncharacterized membrane protein YukC